MSSFFVLAVLALQVPGSQEGSLQNAPPPLEVKEPNTLVAEGENTSPEVKETVTHIAPEPLKTHIQGLPLGTLPVGDVEVESCDVTTGNCRKRLKPVRKIITSTERIIQRPIISRACPPKVQRQNCVPSSRHCRGGLRRSGRCRGCR